MMNIARQENNILKSHKFTLPLLLITSKTDTRHVPWCVFVNSPTVESRNKVSLFTFENISTL